MEFTEQLPEQGALRHHIGHVVYSASALDLDTMVCLLEGHNIRGSPRNTQKLEDDRGVSGQPAQSALLYAVSAGDVATLMCRTSVGVPLYSA